MIFFRTLKFLKYILFSQHGKGHGIQSPFVFNLVSGVFRNKIDPDIVLTIENIRKNRISDRRIIDVLDLGAGPSMKKSSVRRVSDIAKYSVVPEKYGKLLFNLSAEFGKPGIIELGTSLGISTMYQAAGCRETVVYTMEGSSSLAELARENFRKAGLENIKLLTGSFEDLLPEICEKATTPGLVFIDGNHRKEHLLRYFSQMAEISGTGTVIVLDDIHLSTEMEEAWTEIRQYENVSFTIDIFRMGLVFFRKGMNHFDYVIRY
jgi:predicted O-methyltransferase YrrM